MRIVANRAGLQRQQDFKAVRDYAFAGLAQRRQEGVRRGAQGLFGIAPKCAGPKRVIKPAEFAVHVTTQLPVVLAGR